MHSDGLHPFYNLVVWHPVLNNPQRLATALLEDQGKETDDACVLVYRHLIGDSKRSFDDA